MNDLSVPDAIEADATAPPRCRILVVEDEYIVACDLCAELTLLGVDVVGPAGSVEQALVLARGADPLHGALLDVNIGGREVFPVADVLAARNIPFVFATGYDRSVLPAHYRGDRQVEKPVMVSELRRAIGDICTGTCRLAPIPSRT